jgi:hypothetical protein
VASKPTEVTTTTSSNANASLEERAARRATAEQIISGCYAQRSRAAPRFLWFESPVACALAWQLLDALSLIPAWRLHWTAKLGLLRFRRPRGGHIRGELWRDLDRGLAQALRGTLGRHGVRFGGTASRCWTDFWSQLETSIGAEAGARLREELWLSQAIDQATPVRILLAEQVHGFWGGTLEGVAHGQPRVTSEHVAVRLDALQRACGFWSPRAEFVLCSDPVQRIIVDANYRLHCDQGAALELSQEHKLYAWHGTFVPPAWIESRDSIDPDVALTWQIPEQRRAATEIIGWPRALERLPSTVIDVDRDPAVGKLLEYQLPGVGVARFLRVRCGTGREFILSVPRQVNSALEANAWTYGLQAHEYQLEVRT